MTKIIISDICDDNHHEITLILGFVGYAGMDRHIDEITKSVDFRHESIAQDDIAITVGRLLLAGFSVVVK